MTNAFLHENILMTKAQNSMSWFRLAKVKCISKWEKEFSNSQQTSFSWYFISLLELKKYSSENIHQHWNGYMNYFCSHYISKNIIY